MSNFAKLDGIADLIHCPRVGRSGFLTSVNSIQENNPIGLEKIIELSNGRGVNIISLVNLKIQSSYQERF